MAILSETKALSVENKDFLAVLTDLEAEPKRSKSRPSHLLIKLNEYLPFVTKILGNTLSGTNRFSQLIGHFADAAKTLRSANLGITIIDLLRYPLFSFSAWLMGEKNDFVLSQFALWLYSVLSFTIPLLLAAFPVAAFACMVSFSTIGLLLAARDVYLLVSNRKTLPAEKEKLNAELPNLQAELAANLQLLADFKMRYLQAQGGEQQALLMQEFQAAALESKIKDGRARLQTVQDRIRAIDVLREREGRWEFFKRNLSLATAAIALAGLITAFFLPVVGISLTLSAVIGKLFSAVADLTVKQWFASKVLCAETVDSAPATYKPDSAQRLVSGLGLERSSLQAERQSRLETDAAITESIEPAKLPDAELQDLEVKTGSRPETNR